MREVGGERLLASLYEGKRREREEYIEWRWDDQWGRETGWRKTLDHKS